ncbi:MAG: permease [Spirochaetaceae bacterium]|nr:MAG: permease [Spirochaetaceae bacterium]
MALVILTGVWLFAPDRAEDAVRTIGLSLRELVLVIPPVFVLLGLLDIWISRERLMRHLGAGTGIRGTTIAFVMGSVAAGPLYAAFPVATVLMKKGCSFFNVMVFIGAWSTTKIPMFLFEYSALGPTFALTRLAANVPAILLMSFILSRVVKADELAELVAE